MTEPDKKQAPEEADLEKETSEEATLEETRAKEEQDFNSILHKMVAITGLISFFVPVLILFPFCSYAVAPGVARRFFMRLPFPSLRLLGLLLAAILISAIVGLFLCLVLLCDNDDGRKKTGIVFSALADVFGLVFFVFMSIALLPFK